MQLTDLALAWRYGWGKEATHTVEGLRVKSKEELD